MMKTKAIKPLLTKLATASALSMAATSGWTLPDDNQQPINIQSDRATQKSFENGAKTEYFGHVVMTQGSLLITGNHVVIHSRDRKATKVVALGKPAKFQQQSDPAKPPIKAQANAITYTLKQEMLVLKGDAQVEQEGSTVSGQRIEYNTVSEKVSASGGEGSVNMVFLPANSPSDEEPKENNDANNSAVIKDTNANSDSQ